MKIGFFSVILNIDLDPRGLVGKRSWIWTVMKFLNRKKNKRFHRPGKTLDYGARLTFVNSSYTISPFQGRLVSKMSTRCPFNI